QVFLASHFCYRAKCLPERTCSWRHLVASWPCGQDFSPEPETTEARSRRGAELGENDRDPWGRLLVRAWGLVPSSARAFAIEGSEGAEHHDEQHTSSTSSASARRTAPRRWRSSAEHCPARDDVAAPAGQGRRRAYPSDRAARRRRRRSRAPERGNRLCPWSARQADRCGRAGGSSRAGGCPRGLGEVHRAGLLKGSSEAAGETRHGLLRQPHGFDGLCLVV